MVKINCIICATKNLNKDTIAINKKMLNTKITNFYCMSCLADHLNCTEEDLLEWIEEFKNEGCALFQN